MHRSQHAQHLSVPTWKTKQVVRVCGACSQMQKFMSMSRDDMVVNSLSASFDKMREWPFCVGSPEGIKDQAFLPRQAQLVLALAGQLPSVACHSSDSPAVVLESMYIESALLSRLPELFSRCCCDVLAAQEGLASLFGLPQLLLTCCCNALIAESKVSFPLWPVTAVTHLLLCFDR